MDSPGTLGGGVMRTRMTTERRPASVLPSFATALAVFAHPDDESFGLGAVLAKLVEAGTQTAAVCFTHGEASTLNDGETDLGPVRSRELADAASFLGLVHSELLDFRDGHLNVASVDELAAHVVRAAQHIDADVLITFDEGGITGHSDHRRATESALRAANQLHVGVLGWAVAVHVAGALNDELGTHFVGRSLNELDFLIPVDRVRQCGAIACHRSQAAANPVLWRRLELSGPSEPLRWLRRPPSTLAPGRDMTKATTKARGTPIPGSR